MRDDSTLVTLAVQFALLSLFAVGGATSAIPEYRYVARTACPTASVWSTTFMCDWL